MDKKDWQKLLSIRTHCEDVASFLERAGHDREAFLGDRLYFNAVSMCILQIGELANGLSEEYRKATRDEIPWDMIRGMRNWLAHAYGEIDEEMIWNTATQDIPRVLAFCNKELNT